MHANGDPYIAIGDAPWSLPVNCTNAQILTYLNDRASKGCTAILVEAIEKAYSSQTPRWRNTDGNDPFTVMTPPNWVLNSAYWNRVDFIVNEAAARGIAVFITPAYTGYGNGGDGWRAEYSSSTDAALQAYGAALATRYRQGNVVWVLGGDDANDLARAGAYGSSTTPDRTKQWQIVIGLRSVRTSDLITGHTARNQNDGTVNGESFKAWAGYPGWNLNNTYGHDGTDDMVALADTAWARPGPIPFFMIEAGYENLDGSNRGGWVPAVQNVLSGGLGGFIAGHDALWHFGSYDPSTGAQAVISTYLAGSFLDSRNFGQLLKSYPWHRLRPVKDTRLVTTPLGTGSSAVVPALATDGSFAFVFSPGAAFTVQLSALTHAQVRARWFDVEAGTFTAITGSPFPNAGTRVFTPPALRILVLD